MEIYNNGELMARDMQIEILARLPVKSLVRFMSVSKFFYHLIKSDNHFKHKHYEISRRTKDSAVVRIEVYSGDYYSFYKESDEIEIMYMNTPKSNIGRLDVKCCHGLFCLITDNICMIKNEDLNFNTLILNPSTRGIKRIPSITVPYRRSKNVCVSLRNGFGLSNNMLWKVVILVQFTNGFSYCIVDEIVMVYSHVGDSGSWKQIQSAPHVLVLKGQDFYFRGRYYWRIFGHESEPVKLLWFDLDNEVFGTIESPSRFSKDIFTVMNDTIALIKQYEGSVEIWLMSEDNDNISWHKHLTCDTSIYPNPERTWKEVWNPIGIFNLNRHLLVYPHCKFNRCQEYPMGEMGFTPHVISIDLVTQERKIIYLTREGRRIDMGSGEVYNGANFSLAEEWCYANFPYFSERDFHFQVHYESLFLL